MSAFSVRPSIRAGRTDSSNSQYSRPSSQTINGFTLVELVMVILLISVLASISLTRFFNRSDFDQHVIVQDLLASLRYAQQFAMQSGCRTQFRLTDNQYQVFRQSQCLSGDFQLAITEIPASKESSTKLTTSTPIITFDINGQTDIGSQIQIGEQQIKVVATTGFSYVSSPK